jgi:hypothetical protein
MGKLLDFKRSRNAPRAFTRTHVAEFDPGIDGRSIRSLTTRENLDRRLYRSRGCTSFMCSKTDGLPWRVVVLELTDKPLRRQLQECRSTSYNGPALRSMSVAEKAIGSHRKTIRKAKKLLELIDLAQKWERRN